MQDLRCMSFVGKEQNHLVVAGCQNGMLKIDVERGKILEIVCGLRTAHCALLKSHSFLRIANTLS